jgi:hypothetical protein
LSSTTAAAVTLLSIVDQILILMPQAPDWRALTPPQRKRPIFCPGVRQHGATRQPPLSLPPRPMRLNGRYRRGLVTGSAQQMVKQSRP